MPVLRHGAGALVGLRLGDDTAPVGALLDRHLDGHVVLAEGAPGGRGGRAGLPLTAVLPDADGGVVAGLGPVVDGGGGLALHPEYLPDAQSMERHLDLTPHSPTPQATAARVQPTTVL